MDWFIVVVAVLLLALGTPIALAWWKLARKAAPYQDERSKSRPVPRPDDGAEVIVLPTSSDSKRPH
jgi:hypothetical protein